MALGIHHLEKDAATTLARAVHVAGDAAFATARFGFTMPSDEGTVRVDGERVRVLQRTASGWAVILELTWPVP